jgi:enolase-phosphatase E1
LSPAPLRAVLLDVEGTTTAISFVSDVLFPFARERLRPALANTAPDDALAPGVALLREEWESDAKLRERIPDFGDGAVYALALMDEDRKSTGLKAIQGVLWEAGYRDGTLRAHVFDDVPEALQRWRKAGLGLFVFSSGSVLAQKLLFAHTERGDLLGFFDGHFDTATGPKREPAAYAAIASAIALPPAQVLFLSDVVAELDAARAAGMQTGLLDRPGNAPVEGTDHPRHSSFASIPA